MYWAWTKTLSLMCCAIVTLFTKTGLALKARPITSILMLITSSCYTVLKETA